MKWDRVCSTHPDQWLVIEALSARHEGAAYVVDDVAVVDACGSSQEALTAYRRLHKAAPSRELLFVHTSRPTLEIEERRWAGVRMSS